MAQKLALDFHGIMTGVLISNFTYHLISCKYWATHVSFLSILGYLSAQIHDHFVINFLVVFDLSLLF